MSDVVEEGKEKKGEERKFENEIKVSIFLILYINTKKLSPQAHVHLGGVESTLFFLKRKIKNKKVKILIFFIRKENKVERNGTILFFSENLNRVALLIVLFFFQ